MTTFHTDEHLEVCLTHPSVANTPTRHSTELDRDNLSPRTGIGASAHQLLAVPQFIIRPNSPGTALAVEELVLVLWSVPDEGSSKPTTPYATRHRVSALISLQTNSLKIKYCYTPKPANLSFYILCEL